MTTTAVAAYAFTKLVVNDLERMVTYYEEVYGLKRLGDVRAQIGGEAIEETMLGSDAAPSLILLSWVDRPSASPGEVILGFTTPDIRSLFAKAHAAGGRTRQAPQPSPEAGGLIVGFLEDPEGHLTEVVEMPQAV
jgi:predicted enzyme related to lactoylglutathione lyase